jgi:hypothetical protein
MTQPPSFSNASVESFHSLINRILVHEDRFKAHPSEQPAITILLEQRDLSQECALWFMRAKAEGHTMESISALLALAEDASLSKMLCMAFMNENLREVMIETLSDEGDYLNAGRMLDPFECQNNYACESLNKQGLENDLAYWRILVSNPKAPMPSEPYTPFVLRMGENPDRNALKGLLAPKSVADAVDELFDERLTGQIDAQKCAENLAKLLRSFRFNAQVIQKVAARRLNRMSLIENEPVRHLILGSKPPTLGDLSDITASLLRQAANESRAGETQKAFENLIQSASTNQFYFDHCLVPDLIETIQQQSAYEDRYGQNDRFAGGIEKFKEYIKGLKALRDGGIDLNLLMLRSVCKLSTGQAFQTHQAGAQASILQLMSSFCSMKSDETANKLNSVINMYILSCVLSHKTEHVLKAIGNNEIYARALYEASSDVRFLKIITDEATHESIFSKDLGL